MVRPREFDEDEAMARAMDTFWAGGFEGTSLDALEESTGLKRSSLYNAFGGKLELFCKALDAYSAGPCRELFRPLREERGAEALRGYLDGLRAFVRSSDAGKGCFMVNTSLESSPDEAVRRRIDGHFRVLRTDLYRAYGAGLEDESVNDSLSPEEAADWLLTFVRGVLAGAASGETAGALERSIAIAIRQLDLESE